MNLLAFDTSTETMSVAVQRHADGQLQLWQHSAPGGSQTSTHLIPAIQALMAQAGLRLEELQSVVFGSGPGSFTGLRTACSVAQGLAFGLKIPVLPVETLLAVAEEARWQQQGPVSAPCEVQALLDARMDEMYTARYGFDGNVWRQTGGYSLICPETLEAPTHCILAGNVFAAYGERLPASAAVRIGALPSASAMLRLAPALIAAGRLVAADQALPLYIRDKVAKTTAERSLEQARK